MTSARRDESTDVGALQNYLHGLNRIQATGEAVEETSYYGQLEALLNAVGNGLSPKVLCVLTTRNRGAGVPDGGLFLASRAVNDAGERALVARAPERGVMEVKGPGQDVVRVARTQQVRRYLERYGKVLVTNYRDFLPLMLASDGTAVTGERFTLAADEATFWVRCRTASDTDPSEERAFEEYLGRVLLGDAPLSSPADVAAFLAAYARTGLQRLEQGGNLRALSVLRTALEDALGLRFEDEDGEHFFRSALVQTLFYGVFAAWVVWAEDRDPQSDERFSWKEAQWTLNVPMVRVLFEQLATPTTLPVGLDEVLNWTEELLNRVDRKLFFERFQAAAAVQYFYEPFLQAYDPELRRELGVWYTPPEVVRYMVARVDEALREHLGLPLGLADERVHILDPCTGTGSFLVETISTIASRLEAEHGDALVAAQTKQAALSRVHGFELLPAPFVVAHLQVGLALQRLGAPLDAAAHERAPVYLTNTLTGWAGEKEHPQLPFAEFEVERDAADSVKHSTRILVVIGNPPYNGFAGVSGREEGGLVDAYKEGLTSDWDITKNKLDDLYVRFFRVAERRIAELTGQGIVCFISNFSWLGDPSSVVMRRRLLGEFDRVTVDNLNGDSRETGKRTPEGLPDPSVFSTGLSTGIQVGTAVSLLVRAPDHSDEHVDVRYRDFWGATKRADLLASLAAHDAPAYEALTPSTDNWYRLRPWTPRHGYESWPAVTDLAAEEPLLGLNENRAEALFSIDETPLRERIEAYLDPAVPLDRVDERLQKTWATFRPADVRKDLLNDAPFDESKLVPFLVKPFDLRTAYVETETRLWNRSRPQLVAASALGSDFLLVRRRAPRALDGATLLHSRHLIDQHVMHKDAYVIPYIVPVERAADDDAARLFDLTDGEDGPAWRPNLSDKAIEYLTELGVDAPERSVEAAALLWSHVLAIGYSPLYLEENNSAIGHDWPRMPLPDSLDELERSAELGRRLAALLDIDTKLQGVDRRPAEHLKSVATPVTKSGAALGGAAGQLAQTAGWGRRQQSGVFPGGGTWELRARAEDESGQLTDEQLELLGEDVLDIYLNDDVYWSGVPEAAFDYKVGGFSVLRKWLSYREERVLGRELTVDDVRTFRSIARRLTEIVLLGAKLDANYIAATESPLQERLLEAGT
jgi:hypothetical protein